MKKYFLLFILLSPNFLFGQEDIKKIVAEKKAIPSDWVNILTAKDSWRLTNDGSWSNGKVLSLKKNKSGNTISFGSDSLLKDGNKNKIQYYPVYKTFYTGKNFDEFWDMGVSVASEVIYIDSSLLIIRKIPFFLFEKETGRIMSFEEFQKGWEEKKKNLPKKEFTFSNHFIEPEKVVLEVYRAD